MASEDHTTLLLNCYTKRKDVMKLDEFIKVSASLCARHYRATDLSPGSEKYAWWMPNYESRVYVVNG